MADNVDGSLVHVRARDVNMICVSRAPLNKLQKYKARMGWSFTWVSSHGGNSIPNTPAAKAITNG
jgi:predicted dithiol-disulfide oxidoreductase (DUF899 family)